MKTNLKQNRMNAKNIILTICMVILAIHTQAQSSSKWSISAGMNFSPMMSLNLEDTSKGTTSSVGVLGIIALSKENDTFGLVYSANNSFGLLYFRTLPHSYGLYMVAKKNTITEGGYSGIGASYKINSQFLFLEVGNGSWKGISPSVSLGVIVPIRVKLSKN